MSPLGRVFPTGYMVWKVLKVPKGASKLAYAGYRFMMASGIMLINASLGFPITLICQNTRVRECKSMVVTGSGRSVEHSCVLVCVLFSWFGSQSQMEKG